MRLYEKAFPPFFWYKIIFSKCKWMNESESYKNILFLYSHICDFYYCLVGGRLCYILSLFQTFIFAKYMWAWNHHLCSLSSLEVLHNHESHCLKRADFVLVCVCQKPNGRFFSVHLFLFYALKTWQIDSWCIITLL